MNLCRTAIAVILLTTPLAAQNWVARYDGSAGDEDVPSGLAVDDSGCVYVTGSSWGSGTSNDCATVKYGPDGEPRWVARYDGAEHGSDEARAVAVRDDRVAVTGGSAGASLSADLLVLAYSSAGDSLWAALYNGPGDGNDQGLATAIDAAANVYVTGYASDSINGWDFVTIKYDGSGARQWTTGFGTEYEDYAVAVDVDDDGNVYVAGNSGSPYFLTWDYVTAKYNASGVEQWAVRYEGPAFEDDEVRDIAVDGAGNVYVTGGSRDSTTGPDFTTIKYNPAGETLWLRRYDGPAGGTDEANALALDAMGNLYVTGFSQDTANDFDYATVKYGPDGTRLWVARYDGPAHGFDEARDIAVDETGVYVTGNSTGDGTRADFATVKYDLSGAEQWVERYDGPAGRQDEPVALALSGRGALYVTGGSAGSGSGTDYATLRYDAVGISERKGTSVRRDDAPPGIVRGTLSLPAGTGGRLYDAAGRRVRVLTPGTNNLFGIAPGVYYARLVGDRDGEAARRIIIAD